jgi:hypothetical protein
MSDTDQCAFREQCLVYDDELRRRGHLLGVEALQRARDAVTLEGRYRQVAVADGPYVETTVPIGGVLVLEARDLNHAIALLAKHPGLRVGPFEIRAVAGVIGATSSPRAARGSTAPE